MIASKILFILSSGYNVFLFITRENAFIILFLIFIIILQLLIIIFLLHRLQRHKNKAANYNVNNNTDNEGQESGSDSDEDNYCSDDSISDSGGIVRNEDGGSHPYSKENYNDDGNSSRKQ